MVDGSISNNFPIFLPLWSSFLSHTMVCFISVNDRTDRQLLRVVKTNRRKTLQDITATLNEGTPVKISHSTVRRRLLLQLQNITLATTLGCRVRPSPRQYRAHCSHSFRHTRTLLPFPNTIWVSSEKITFFQKCSTVQCSFDLHHALRFLLSGDVYYRSSRRIVKKKIIVSNVNRFKRRAWCRSKLHCT
jgi:hypothetical protein